MKLCDDVNKLFFVPTCTNEKGDEVVRFEEELVREGCEKWKFTVCGYVVGCRMSVNELKYNIRRMWGRLGLRNRKNSVGNNGNFNNRFQGE